MDCSLDKLYFLSISGMLGCFIDAWMGCDGGMGSSSVNIVLISVIWKRRIAMMALKRNERHFLHRLSFTDNGGFYCVDRSTSSSLKRQKQSPSDVTGDKISKCPLCQMQFGSVEGLDRHIKANGITYKCRICEMKNRNDIKPQWEFTRRNYHTPLLTLPTDPLWSVWTRVSLYGIPSLPLSISVRYRVTCLQLVQIVTAISVFNELFTSWSSTIAPLVSDKHKNSHSFDTFRSD